VPGKSTVQTMTQLTTTQIEGKVVAVRSGELGSGIWFGIEGKDGKEKSDSGPIVVISNEKKLCF
jgi:hypothetical protein